MNKRGKNEQSKNNLKKGKMFSKEYQPSPLAKSNGKQKKIKMREMLGILLEKEVKNKKGETATTLEAISVSLIKQAMSGNVKAFEVIRDTIGEKPEIPMFSITQAVQVNKNDIEEAVNIINELR